MPKVTNPPVPKSTDNLAALSIPEFCRRHDISRSTFYNLRKQKHGPRETRIGRRVVITHANAISWLKKVGEGVRTR